MHKKQHHNCIICSSLKSLRFIKVPSYEAARKRCQKYGLDLAIIESKQEMADLAELLKPTGKLLSYYNIRMYCS